MICGAILGISLMRWHFIRDAEPGQWRNWFAGGSGIFLCVLLSGFVSHRVAIIPLIPLCFADWWKLTRPNRKERVAWGPAIGLGLLSFFLAGFGGDPIVSAGVIVGAIIGIQIISPFGPAVATAATGQSRKAHGQWKTHWQSFVDRRRENSQPSASVQPDPGVPSPQVPSSGTGKRHVPSWLRGFFMLAMMVTLGTWIYAFIAMGCLSLNNDEQALALSFGLCGVLSFFFCLVWCSKKTFKSWYRFLVKPAVILFLLNVIIAASSITANVRLSGEEEAIALFFIIFPAVLFFVVLFIPARVVEDLTGLTPVEDLSASKVTNTVSPKSRLGALMLCLLPLCCALCGLQRFYAGKIKTGILWLLTGGLFGIGQLIDFILILSGGFRDANGRLISDWNPPANATRMSPAPNPTKENPEATAPSVPVAGPQHEAPPVPVANGSGYGSSTPIWQAVEEFNPIGRLLAGLGFVLLLAATLVGLFVALHVPWFVSSGFPDPEIGKQIQDFFGYADWPNLVETIGIVVCALISVASLGLIITGRRKAGAFHIIRAIMGVTALVIALATMSDMIPSHFFKDPGYTMPAYRQEQRDDFKKMIEDQEVGHAVGYLVDHVDEDMVILGGSLLIVSVITLSWPAKRKKKQIHSVQSQTV